MIHAEVIADSVRATGPGEPKVPRLHTQRWTHPTFNHQEALRHRKLMIHDLLALAWEPDFSFSVSSSRAIPFHKLIEEAADPNLRARPVRWGQAQRGMVPGDELGDDVARHFWPAVALSVGVPANLVDGVVPGYVTDRQLANLIWDTMASLSASAAEAMGTLLPIHKTYPNRIVAPYVHTHCLVTGTTPGWLNFFGLRLDAAADPTLRALAEAAWRCWNESTPRKLQVGEWHLPFITEEDHEITSIPIEGVVSGRVYDDSILIEISVARCARLSYESFDTGKRSTIEEDLALYERLVGSLPLHASPAEHQATPDTWRVNPLIANVVPKNLKPRPDTTWNSYHVWDNPTRSGNLGQGWLQYRKTLSGEAIAPLPKAYR